VEPKLPLSVDKQNPHELAFSFASAAQNNIFILKKQTSIA
jgi:hypothetical protein